MEESPSPDGEHKLQTYGSKTKREPHMKSGGEWSGLPMKIPSLNASL